MFGQGRESGSRSGILRVWPDSRTITPPGRKRKVVRGEKRKPRFLCGIF
jgi:hypothetical protein